MPELATIAALATAPAPAGLAVVRISGPATRVALKTLFQSSPSPVDDPRRLVFGKIIDFATNQEIDRALAVFMPGPKSYTGEDVGELQFHGSPLLVQKILRSLFAFGITSAEPGEFTRRAFMNGKIDLIQAEAVADLIQASSEEAFKLANEQMQGRFSRAVEIIAEPLRNCLAEIEAQIDFPEDDIEPAKVTHISGVLQATVQELKKLLTTYAYGHAVRDGFRVLLSGPPNAGKSSMLNLLLGTDRAIVSDVPGTTRDLIEEQLTHGGYRFVFCDSAGITSTHDRVEQRGIELARERIPWADLVMFVVDAGDPDRSWEPVLEELRSRAKEIWLVVNKIDRNQAAIGSIVCDSRVCTRTLYVSAHTRDGLDLLKAALLERVASRPVLAGEVSGVVTTERHRACLERATEALGKAMENIRQRAPLEIVSSDVRAALVALEELVGRTFTEDLLGRIFSKFCIGK